MGQFFYNFRIKILEKEGNFLFEIALLKCHQDISRQRHCQHSDF